MIGSPCIPRVAHHDPPLEIIRFLRSPSLSLPPPRAPHHPFNTSETSDLLQPHSSPLFPRHRPLPSGGIQAPRHIPQGGRGRCAIKPDEQFNFWSDRGFVPEDKYHTTNNIYLASLLTLKFTFNNLLRSLIPSKINSSGTLEIKPCPSAEPEFIRFPDGWS